MSPPSFRSFQSCSCRFFSAFARATCSLSVYNLYLGLVLNDTIFILNNRPELLSATNSRNTSLTRLLLSMTLFSSRFSSCSGYAVAHISLLLQARIQFALRSFHSHYSLHRFRFLFLRVLRYFNSPGMLMLAHIIQQSLVQSLTCGYPRLFAACRGLHRSYSLAIP